MDSLKALQKLALQVSQITGKDFTVTYANHKPLYRLYESGNWLITGSNKVILNLLITQSRNK